MSLVLSILGHPLVQAAIRIVGVSILAGVVTTVAAFVFKARVRETLPEGATVILGLGVVAIVLNTRLVFVQFVGDGAEPLTHGEAVVNVSAFVAAGIASYGGRYAGTKLATSERLGWASLQPDFSPLVRVTGRFITVRLPDEIDEIDGYDPVTPETKAALAGRTIDFPRGLTLSALQSQVSARLKEEHDVGYVDVELTDDGTVDYLAVGQRPAGIGPTLPPKSAVVAVRADPPFSATPGDTVQVWRTDGEEPERVVTGELRASVEGVVTVATDESAAAEIDPAVEYRLLTLSAAVHPDREFAAMLRRGDETMSIVELSAESPLVGNPVGGLEVTLIAIRTADGAVDTIPTRDRILRAGDSLFAIAKPDTLRKLESATGTQLSAQVDALTAVGDSVMFDGGTRRDRRGRDRRPDRENWPDGDTE